ADPHAAATLTGTAPGPDLSSLVSTAKGWEAGPGGPPSPAATINGLGGTTSGSGLTGGAMLASGSTKTGTPEGPPAVAKESSYFDASPRVATGPQDLFDPMASFGQGITQRKDSKRGILLIAIGGAVAAAIAVVAVITMTSGDAKPTPTAAVEQPKDVGAPPVTAGDQHTGFDLYVTPAGVTQWKLDGEARTDRLPSRIRGIAPGSHAVQIEPPPGFLSETQQVVVEAGKAGRVDVALQPIQGITGLFESTPPGATVSLIIDGKRETIGPSPAKAPLDPRQTYQVLFEKPGYVSVNRPVTFSGVMEEKTTVNLEKASAVASTTTDSVKATTTTTTPVIAKVDKVKTGTAVKTPGEVKTTEVKTPETKTPEVKPPDLKIDDTKVGTADAKVDTKVKGTGTLMLGSKPSCEIYVDGAPTGLHTPQRELKLSAGKHRITLINNEFGIKEVFSVDIKPDDTTKMIKDYSDRLPK
ncbi:MAG: PEGA domain-containing protein, partial [Myxococcota bacterium]|nr:PEGA domain-containing protein [Myxococcota bacterium]